MEAVPDGIAGEQTWPSEGEMMMDNDNSNSGAGGGSSGVGGAEAGTLEGAGRLRRKVKGEVSCSHVCMSGVGVVVKGVVHIYFCCCS